MRGKWREPGRDAVLAELGRLTAKEQRIRAAKIGLLKRELGRAREAVRRLEKELRLLGDDEAMRSAGRISWNEVYDQLAEVFTAADMATATGASSNLIGSIVHRWKQTGRIAATDQRATYRKVRIGNRRHRG